MYQTKSKKEMNKTAAEIEKQARIADALEAIARCAQATSDEALKSGLMQLVYLLNFMGGPHGHLVHGCLAQYIGWFLKGTAHVPGAVVEQVAGLLDFALLGEAKKSVSRQS